MIDKIDWSLIDQMTNTFDWSMIDQLIDQWLIKFINFYSLQILMLLTFHKGIVKEIFIPL